MIQKQSLVTVETRGPSLGTRKKARKTCNPFESIDYIAIKGEKTLKSDDREAIPLSCISQCKGIPCFSFYLSGRRRSGRKVIN
jgi:hypothetical protein